MHELSIVMSIIDTAREQVAKNQATRVESIALEIGTLAGIEIDALNFSWEAAVPDTVLAQAERQIHDVPARARCTVCRHVFDLQQLFEPCPQCGDYFSELLQGKELKIKRMTLEL